MRHLWKIAAVSAAMLASPLAHAIDCARASTPVEQTICGNAELKAYDSYLGEAYARLKSDYTAETFAAIQRSQRRWLEQRDRACGTDVACLIRETQARTATLVQMARSTNEAPTAPVARAPGKPLPAVAPSSQPLSPRELFQRVAPSLVVVLTFDDKDEAVSQGSGVVLANNVVATNCHVVEKAAKAVALYGGVAFGANRMIGNSTFDYCVLMMTDLPAPPVQMGGLDTVTVGQRVYSVGSPRGLELTIAEGLVSGLRQEDGIPLPVIQTSAPLSPGSSGGGLFDEYGRVIGITTKGLIDSQNLNFAMPVELINVILEP